VPTVSETAFRSPLGAVLIEANWQNHGAKQVPLRFQAGNWVFALVDRMGAEKAEAKVLIKKNKMARWMHNLA
jgi:hypothetical protein